MVDASHAPINDVTGPGAVVAGSALVLTTQEQFMFATVAAPPKRRRAAPWLSGITRLFGTTKHEGASDGDRRTPRHVPKRYDYLENAAMSRAMERL